MTAIRRALAAAVLALALPLAALARDAVTIGDGDSLKQDGVTYRPYGILRS